MVTVDEERMLQGAEQRSTYLTTKLSQSDNFLCDRQKHYCSVSVSK